MWPSMLTCGTPAAALLEEQRHPSMTTYCLRPHSVSSEGNHGLRGQMLPCNQ